MKREFENCSLPLNPLCGLTFHCEDQLYIDRYKYYLSKTNTVWSLKPIAVCKLRHFGEHKQTNLFTAYYHLQ